MLTYSFENRGTDTLYEYLYKQIKKDIVEKRISPDEKLPSKRMLAKNLNVSVVTVENAYSQLLAEGYIYSLPRSGFYVSRISVEAPAAQRKARETDFLHVDNLPTKADYFADFVSNSTAASAFPFSIWTKMMRETMTSKEEMLMKRSPSQGIWELRMAISDYLYQFRGMEVSPERIIVGAGTEYLYGLLIQLLGYDKCYAVEDPGYQKIPRIYHAHNVSCLAVPMDEQGISLQYLKSSGADIVHISPSHHFPTGRVMPIGRRYELLSWAAENDSRYIIEDEYDSEFRLMGKPIPTLLSIDTSDKVIYMNTFSKSLSSTIRISYMILPETLMKKYNKELSFYSNTVPNFEQYTLADFINRGYLEKHINRMRTYYRDVRDRLLFAMKCEMDEKKIRIAEENAGLHFLLEIHTGLSDRELVKRAADHGIHISCLSEYCNTPEMVKPHMLVINYSGIAPDKVSEAVKRLMKSI